MGTETPCSPLLLQKTSFAMGCRPVRGHAVCGHCQQLAMHIAKGLFNSRQARLLSVVSIWLNLLSTQADKVLGGGCTAESCAMVYFIHVCSTGSTTQPIPSYLEQCTSAVKTEFGIYTFHKDVQHMFGWQGVMALLLIHAGSRKGHCCPPTMHAILCTP